MSMIWFKWKIANGFIIFKLCNRVCKHFTISFNDIIISNTMVGGTPIKYRVVTVNETLLVTRIPD